MVITLCKPLGMTSGAENAAESLPVHRERLRYLFYSIYHLTGKYWSPLMSW